MAPLLYKRGAFVYTSEMDIYEQLRTIGVSIETADALAPVLEKMPKRKQEAFVLWAMGYSYREAGRACGFSREIVRKIISRVRGLTNKPKKYLVGEGD